MHITHEEARRLIQFNADGALKGTEKNQLEDHLESCLECRLYAGSIKELESILVPMMQKRWPHPLPRPASLAASREHPKLSQNITLATRIVAMSVICIAFLFNIWQFTFSAEQNPDPSMNVPPVPTPSVFSTTTQALSHGCEQVLYRVQENDTLESIAKRFSVPTDEIMDFNHIKDATLQASMNLMIPICSPTPSTTVASTYTPLLGPTTSTPKNSPTQ